MTAAASRGDRLAHAEQAASAFVANSSEGASLRARAVRLEGATRSMRQRFPIHHHGRSAAPLPDELSPDEHKRICGPIGLGKREPTARAASLHRRTRRASALTRQPRPISPFSGELGWRRACVFWRGAFGPHLFLPFDHHSACSLVVVATAPLRGGPSPPVRGRRGEGPGPHDFDSVAPGLGLIDLLFVASCCAGPRAAVRLAACHSILLIPTSLTVVAVDRRKGKNYVLSGVEGPASRETVSPRHLVGEQQCPLPQNSVAPGRVTCLLFVVTASRSILYVAQRSAFEKEAPKIWEKCGLYRIEVLCSNIEIQKNLVYAGDRENFQGCLPKGN